MKWILLELIKSESAQTDGDVLDMLLFWHPMQLDRRMLNDVIDLMPEDLQESQVVKLLALINDFHANPPKDENEWMNIANVLEPYQRNKNFLIAAYSSYYRYLTMWRSGRGKDELDGLYQNALTLVRARPQGKKSIHDTYRQVFFLALLAFQRARQILAKDEDEAWKRFNEAGHLRKGWLIILGGNRKLPDTDIRVLHAATLIGELVATADALFGPGSRESMEIAPDIKPLLARFRYDENYRAF